MPVRYEPDAIDNDMKDLEYRLKMLRVEYNQYFVGARKEPPNFTDIQVRKIIRKYVGDKTLKGPQRFVFFNLVARYNTLREFWNRRIRLREQTATRGTAQSSVPKSLQDLYQQRLEESKPRFENAYQIRDTQRDEKQLRRLYLNYVKALRQFQGDSGFVNYGKFSTMIRAKTQQMVNSKGHDAVQYRVSIDGNAVKLKAKGLHTSVKNTPE